MNTKLKPVVTALALLLAPAAVMGAGDHDHKHGHKHEHKHDYKHEDKHGHVHDKKRQLGAHEHGVSTVKVAVDGDEVEVMLESPGVDIVGFEHAAKSDADKASVAAALKKLGEPANVVQLNPAAACKLEEAETELHEEDGGHTEFEAHYHFHCDKPGALTRVSFPFFKTFPGAREIDAQAVTGAGAAAAELTPAEPVLTLPQ